MQDCNGDDKREQSWRDLLHTRTTDTTERAESEARIQAWLDEHAREPMTDTPEIVESRAQIDDLIGGFVDQVQLTQETDERADSPRS